MHSRCPEPGAAQVWAALGWAGLTIVALTAATAPETVAAAVVELAELLDALHSPEVYR